MAGTIGELVIPGMSLPTAGATIGYLLIFFGMLRENTFEDPVTGLYNSFFLERISQEASAGAYSFSSGILFYSDDIGEYMAKNGIIAKNNLMREAAMTLRDELPEGCETMFLGGSRFLIISKVTKEHEEAIEVSTSSETLITDSLLLEYGFEPQKQEGHYYKYVKYDEYREVELHEYSDTIWIFHHHDVEFSTPDTQITICDLSQLRQALALCGCLDLLTPNSK
jgi:hypothetical protein